MDKDHNQKQENNVVQLSPKTASKESHKKWGKAVIDRGFCIFPSLILRAQRRLQLNPSHLAILLHLADFWWDEGRHPYPSKQTLSERLGIGPRQVQRYIAELEEMGLVKRIERRAQHKGKLSNSYDLSGLVERLQELEPEFRQVDEENRSRRRQVAQPGLRRRRKAPA